jgi:hypothetical protein
VSGAWPTLAPILALSAAGVLAAAALWAWLAERLALRIRSRLRAVPLALPLLLGALGYGAYWSAFFATPGLAVQMHAVRLTLAHAAGPALPLLAGVWLALSLWALAPLLRRR